MGTSYEELEKKVANEEIFEGKTEQELSSQFLGSLDGKRGCFKTDRYN